MSPGFRKKTEKYAPWLGVIVIMLFVVISSVTVTVQKREEYRRNTFDVYLAEGAKEREAQQEQQADEAPPEEITEGEGIHSPIYAAPSGKRYHYDARCPGKNSQEITWDEAEQRGLTPCKKCVLK